MQKNNNHDQMKYELSVDNCINFLEAAGIHRPSTEAKKIVRHVLGDKWNGELNNINLIADDADKSRIIELLHKRSQHIPFSRLCDVFSFCSLDIEAGEGVFAPYPETEEMLENVIDFYLEREAPARILDLGSGSGCILLSLLKAFPKTTGVGIDNNEKALALSRRNAERNGLAARAEFRQGDWGAEISEQFDLVISNPPRVATHHIPHLIPEMKDFDPHHSLDGGKDGTKFFKLFAQRLNLLAKDGAIGIVQVGPRYAQAVHKIFSRQGFHNSTFMANTLGQPAALIVMNDKAVRRSWLFDLLSNIRKSFSQYMTRNSTHAK